MAATLLQQGVMTADRAVVDGEITAGIAADAVATAMQDLPPQRCIGLMDLHQGVVGTAQGT